MAAAPSVAETAPSPAPPAESAPAPGSASPEAATKAPPAPQPSFIRTEAAGFSPVAADPRFKVYRFGFTVGNRDFLKSWRLEIRSMGGLAKSWSGPAAELPPALDWDGRDEAGEAAPEGRYSASLSLEYEGGLPPARAEAAPFYLAVSPPRPTLAVEPPLLVPTSEGLETAPRLSIEGNPALARLESWSVELLDAAGRRLKTWEGPWDRTAAEGPSFTWDGKLDSGELLAPGSRYSLVAAVSDEFGNAGKVRAELPVAALEPPLDRGAVRPAGPGFSPNGDGTLDLMELYLSYGLPESLVEWRLDLNHAERGRIKSFRGTGPSRPASLVWDGLAEDGSPAPEGRYVPLLASDYGRAAAPAEVRGSSFVLARTAPKASLSLAPALFSPDGDGLADLLHIRMGASSAHAELESWELEILDEDGARLIRFADEWPAEELVWDGRGDGGRVVESAELYPVRLAVRDRYGNLGRAETTLATDILVVKEGEGYRIDVSSIVFKPYTADYLDVPEDRAVRNLSTLDRLAVKLGRFPEYGVRLVGHAVMENWDDPVLGPLEQVEELLPLSRSRAEAVAKALVDRGLPAERIATEGVGAAAQVVPDWDLANRWRNRRVVFWLERPAPSAAP